MKKPGHGRKETDMRTKIATTVICAAVLIALCGAAKAYRYRCPRTQQVFEYSNQNAHKCPTHGLYHLVPAD